MHGNCGCRLVYRKQLRLDQTIRNLTCGDLEISLVVIRLGVSRLKKIRFLYLQELLRGIGQEEWYDLVCVCVCVCVCMCVCVCVCVCVWSTFRCLD